MLIAARSAFAAVAVMGALFAVASVTSAFKQRPDHLGDLIARAAAATAIFSVPLAVAVPAGILASGLLLLIGAPAVTYVFILFAALVSFLAAVKHPGHGMEGCTKIVGLIWSGYAIIWSAVSFEAVGGLRTFEADALSLRFFQPPLAALPFALLVLKLSARKKRTAWQFLGFWAFLAAIMALSFFPVERGFADGLLPRSDWLRFPLAGLAVVAVLTLLRLAFIARAKPNVRRQRMRSLRSNVRILAAIFAAMGLSWAAARALVGTLV